MTVRPETANDRRRLILDRLDSVGRVEVGDLATWLGVAQETIRRDLTHLEAADSLQRVHGGAIPAETADPLAPFTGAGPEIDDTHRRLGDRIAERLPAHSTVLLAASPLTCAVAESLGRSSEDNGLTIVTNSLDVAVVVSRVPTIRVYNVGGRVDPTSRAQEGDWALTDLARLRVDLAVLAPSGIHSQQGLFSPSVMSAAISQAEATAAASIWLVAEPPVLGRTGFVRFAGLEQVQGIFTTGSEIDTDTARRFQELHIDVITS
ncbi:MAG: DeoR/GlpR family DNA-binding transcription regulator [Microlunatus sp.]|nr:DeoR/GlpR family DNA-binding transcription regulator [Microlunatus sp.]